MHIFDTSCNTFSYIFRIFIISSFNYYRLCVCRSYTFLYLYKHYMCFFSNCRYVQYGIMPGHKIDYFLCILCSKRTKPSDRRKINQNIRKYLRRKFLIEAPSENSVICNRCRHVYRTETQGTKDQMCVLMFHVPQCYHQRTKTNRREACQANHLYRFPWHPLLNLMHIAVCAKSQDQSW